MLSLINVEINAGIDKFEAAMWKSAAIAEDSMTAAAANADQFQSAFDRAAEGVSTSSDKLAGKFEAANDRVMAASDKAVESIDAISEAANHVHLKSWQEKLTTAFGAGIGAGYAAVKSGMDLIEGYVKTKLEILALVIVAGLTAGLATAVVYAYKIVSAALGFITGLFTGEAYKSDNIDAVIALNKEVQTLQDGLHLSAENASATNEALKALGVDSAAYVSTMDAATKAQRTNTEELDRLGIQYKDANGQLLTQEQFLKNVKTALDAYSEGYDRNAAAAAIGVGSYQAVSDAAKVTADAVEVASERLADYGLVIGPGTQEAVAQYEASMLAFNREMDLTSQGVKKAIADQIMPLFADLADFFRDGWPGAVTVFRDTMAVATTALYALKEGAYVVSESVVESLIAIGEAATRGMAALLDAVRGDGAAAWAELKAIPDDLSARWNTFWGNLEAQTNRNVKAVKLAWGTDNDSDFGVNGEGWDDKQKPRGKSWVPRPAAISAPKSRVPAVASEPASPYATFLDQLDQMTAKLDGNQYTMLKVKAAQLAWNEGLSATTALEKINALQVAESDKAVKDYGTRLEEENRRLLDARGAIGLYGIELDAYNLREQRRAEAIAKVNQAMTSGKPLTDEATAAIYKEADAAAKVAEAILRENEALSRTYEVGAKKAFDAYMDNATNAAKTAETQFTTAYQSIETAMTDFLFNPWDKGVNGMLASFGTAVQKMIAQAVAADLGKRLFGAIGTPDGSGLLSALLKAVGLGAKTPASEIASTENWIDSGGLGASSAAASIASLPAAAPMFGFDFGSMIPSFDVGTDYVPRDMLARIHEGERITPKAQNTGGNGIQSVTVNQHFYGATSPADVRRSGGDLARNLLGAMTGARRYV